MALVFCVCASLPTVPAVANAQMTQAVGNPLPPPAAPPNAIQFREEVFVIREMAHLIAIPRSIVLERPVGRRGHYEMHRGVRDPRQVASVAESKTMHRAPVGFRPRDLAVVGVGCEQRPKTLRRVVFAGKGRRPPDSFWGFEKAILRRLAGGFS